MPMTLDDLDQVLEVEHGAFTTPWSRRQFVSELTQNHYAVYLVVKRGRRTIAYGGMWAVLGEAHITNIAVLTEERGRKVGDLLLRSLLLEAEARDCLKVTLEVRRSNVVAQNLYRKYGFLERGVRRGYYTDDGEDAFVMVREGVRGDPALRVPPAPEANAADGTLPMADGRPRA